MGRADDILFDESDLDVDEYYCEHGNFIGNPHGADYMCGWCEDGVSREDFERYMLLQSNRAKRRNVAVMYIQSCPSDFKWDFHPVIGRLIINLYQSMYYGPKGNI